MYASAPQESLYATIQFTDSHAQLHGTMFMAEGWKEPLVYPLDSISVLNDSVRFRFAPAGILIQGRCMAPGKIDMRLLQEMPQPWGTITGSGRIERVP